MKRFPNALLGIYAAILTAAFATLLLSGAKTVPGDAEFDTLTVRRINVVEPDGTLRLVISDHANFPGLILRGKEYPHPRPEAGLIFYNDEGSEQGGLVYSGSKSETGYSSALSLSFDRYEQDQQLQLIGVDENDKTFAGLQINDRPQRPILQDIAERARLEAMPEAQRKELMEKRLKENYYGASRLYAGKTESGSSVVTLRDANGKPRLSMQVTADGKASIEFLDADGKVQRSLSAATAAAR